MYSVMCPTGKLTHMTLSSFLAEMKRCSNPEDIDNGSVRVVDGIRLIRELIAWYSCDRGHALRGPRIRECDLLTGEWEGPAPTCEECKLPTIPITTLQQWDIMLTYSTHYVQHLSTVDILKMLPMEQWMSLFLVQLLGTHVMKDS